MVRCTEPTFKGEQNHWKAVLTSQVMPKAGGSIGASSPVLLGTAGDYGFVCEDIWVQATGDVAANVCGLFVLGTSDEVVTPHSFLSLPAATGTTATSIVANYPVRFVLPNLLFEFSTAKGLLLHPGESLYCALGAAEPTSRFVVNVQGGDCDAE